MDRLWPMKRASAAAFSLDALNVKRRNAPAPNAPPRPHSEKTYRGCFDVAHCVGTGADYFFVIENEGTIHKGQVVLARQAR